MLGAEALLGDGRGEQGYSRHDLNELETKTRVAFQERVMSISAPCCSIGMRRKEPDRGVTYRVDGSLCQW